MTEDELRILDYEKTVEYINQLSDIRFKLLTLLPLATGATLVFAEKGNEPITGALLGMLGCLVTVGIVFYDQRNTEIYEKQIRRAKLIELHLRIPPVSSRDKVGGPFMGRPPRTRKLFGKIEMWHDRGLAFVYSTTLAVWSYLLFTSALKHLLVVQRAAELKGLVVALVVFAVTWDQLHKLDRKNEELEALDNEILKLTNKESGI